jgi:hypothetical protein
MKKEITKSTNDFVQVTRGYISEMRSLGKRSPLAHSMLWLLIERMNKTNAIVISQKAMAELLDAHKGSISRAAKMLSDERWVQVVKIGTSNAYVVNSQVIWRANNRNGKRYTVFNAEVIASESEQSDLAAWDNMELRHVPVISKSEKVVQGNEDLPPPDQREIDTGLSDIPRMSED